MFNYTYTNPNSWECHKCHTIWAPHIDKCTACKPDIAMAVSPLLIHRSGFLQVKHKASSNACGLLHYDYYSQPYSCTICENCGLHLNYVDFVSGICNLNCNVGAQIAPTMTFTTPCSNNLNIKTYNKEVDKFLEDVIKKTSDNNIKFVLSLTDYVKFGESETKSNGYFIDGDAPELAFSFKGDYSIWLTTLIHESCHMEQFLENIPLWQALKVKADGVDEDEDLIFDWIDGREVDPVLLETLIRNTKYMELDCEKRVVEKIKEYNLPLDIPTYTKRANAYALFYNYMHSNRAWYVIGKEPYNDPKILELMSDKFDMDYDNITDELKVLFKECCKNEG